MFKTILVPTDGSPLSDKAAAAAIEFAKTYGGRIVVLSVAEPYPFTPLSEMNITDEREAYEEHARAAAGYFTEKVAKAAREEAVECETRIGQSFAPHDEIVRVAQETGADVIFMSSHGRRGLSKLLLGSETQKVLAHSPIPVLVLR